MCADRMSVSDNGRRDRFEVLARSRHSVRRRLARATVGKQRLEPRRLIGVRVRAA